MATQWVSTWVLWDIGCTMPAQWGPSWDDGGGESVAILGMMAEGVMGICMFVASWVLDMVMVLVYVLVIGQHLHTNLREAHHGKDCATGHREGALGR